LRGRRRACGSRRLHAVRPAHGGVRRNALAPRRSVSYSGVVVENPSPRAAMTQQRFISVAAVVLVAVLSAVFVAVAPVQAQGMVAGNTGLASTELRDEASFALALRAGSLAGIVAQPAPAPADAGRADAAEAAKPTPAGLPRRGRPRGA
jgi:uncharacterized protein YjeT (DUF2065 family)